MRSLLVFSRSLWTDGAEDWYHFRTFCFTTFTTMQTQEGHPIDSIDIVEVEPNITIAWRESVTSIRRTWSTLTWSHRTFWSTTPRWMLSCRFDVRSAACCSCESVSCFECFQLLSDTFRSSRQPVPRICDFGHAAVLCPKTLNLIELKCPEYLYPLYRTLHLIIPIEFPHRTSRRAPCVKDGGVSRGVSCVVCFEGPMPSIATPSLRHTTLGSSRGSPIRSAEPGCRDPAQNSNSNLMESDGARNFMKLWRIETFSNVVVLCQQNWWFAWNLELDSLYLLRTFIPLERLASADDCNA